MAKKDNEEEKDMDEGAEAEGGEGVEGEEGELKKSGKKKLLILILVPLLLIGGGGGAAYYLGYLDSLLGIEKPSDCVEGEVDEHGEPIICDHPEEGDHGEKKADAHGKPAADGHGEKGAGDASPYLAIEPMVVNLATEDGTPRLLRLKVQLELANPSEKHEIELIMPRVIDQYQTYLRGLRPRDLAGSAGIYRLQIELLTRVNQAVAPIEIKDVLFQEILIQ